MSTPHSCLTQNEINPATMYAPIERVHKQFYDRTGMRYGRLLVLRRDFSYPCKNSLWLCRCDCGTEVVLSSKYLSSNGLISCGEHHKLEEGEASFNALLSVYKYGAKRRGLEFSLSTEQFRELTKQPCTYCNTSPENKFTANSSKKGKQYTNGHYLYNGIDRVDNAKGYTSENSVACCEVCNRGKRDMSEADFRFWISKVYSNLNLGVTGVYDA